MRLAIWGLVLSLVPAMVSCDNSLETDKRAQEDKSIESYISSKGWSYTKDNGVYHVAQTKSYGYEVNHGDTILFWYKGYTTKSPQQIFDTNIKSVAIEAKLDTVVRKFEPVKAIVGATPLLSGLSNGLLLCRENQVATILFPSNFGYADNHIGPIEPWSSLAFDIEIIYLNGPGKVTEQELFGTLDLTGYSLHSSGLYYKHVIDTGQTYPADTSMVYGSYTVKQINGNEVESYSTSSEPLDLSTVTFEAIRIGFSLTSVSGIISIIAPSPLAYGKKGTALVAPYTPVEITIKLDSIKTR
ncbi:MAG TPA: hypothetical protein DDY04_08730 [Bacteroidales bacterium]|nr:hypothetical protein [Bacteroidales bacterium]